MLTEGLVSRGVDVTLFATADSITKANLVGTSPTGYSEDPRLDPKVEEALHIATLFERAGDFDLIHNSFDFLPLTFSRLVDTPILTTIHGFSADLIVAVYRRYDPNTHYVAISDADRHPDLHYLATVYHGIEMDRFRPGYAAGDYLLFYGRIHPDKGAVAAIETARRAGKQLLIAGIVQDHAYFSEEVEPHLDGEKVIYLGPVDRDTGAGLLAGAHALLHLIEFEEPFGLSVIESMACGTPVIAQPRGSMPEIISDGVNGYLVEGVDGAVEAVSRVESLDRRTVRSTVETRFSVERMVDDYLSLYRRVLDR